jgi:hypothetical protein
MPTTLSRRQALLVAALYGAMAVLSGLLILKRYLLYLRHPQDVVAASGMYAGGDLLLELMIFCLFLVPTGLLVFFIRGAEPAYTAYAKILLGLSVTAPLSLGLMFVPFLNQGYLGDVIFFRLCATPIFAVVLLLSLSSTQFTRARRLIFYALLIEAIPLAIVLGMLLFSSVSRRGY